MIKESLCIASLALLIGSLMGCISGISNTVGEVGEGVTQQPLPDYIDLMGEPEYGITEYEEDSLDVAKEEADEE
jgi:hypothetical protein